MSPSQIQKILACILIAVLCVLSALHVCRQCCSGVPCTPQEWVCVVLTTILFVLVFAFLCKRTVYKRNADTFSDYQWGYDHNESDLVRTAAPAHDEHSSQTIGPNPGNNTLNTWQYNPQNTLVNYKFYNAPANGTPPTQIAPIMDGSIGKRNQTPTHLQGVGVCNNDPAQQTYAVNSPASNQVVPTGTVGWS